MISRIAMKGPTIPIINFVREFCLDSTFLTQHATGARKMYSLLQLLPAELGHQLSGSRKAERLVKAGPWGISQKHPVS